MSNDPKGRSQRDGPRWCHVRKFNLSGRVSAMDIMETDLEWAHRQGWSIVFWWEGEPSGPMDDGGTSTHGRRETGE